MNDIDYAVEEQACGVAVQRDLRWNWAAFVLEIAFFFLGISIASPSIIMPLYVRHMTDSPLLIGLISTIAGSGWFLPQLLMANYTTRLPRKKPIAVDFGFFAERLPFLVMAVSAFVFGARSPTLALMLFFASLTWHTVGAGIIAVPWQDMMAKIIPVQYRGRMLGLANSAGTAAALAGTSLIASLLERYLFPTGFAICFGIAFVSILISWVFASVSREPPLHSRRAPLSNTDFWRGLPAVLHRDSNFRNYLLVRMLTMLGRMGVGFLAVYAVDRWLLSDSQAGLYATTMLIGQTAANVVFGPLADRHGHKLILEIALVLAGLGMVTAILAPSPAWLYLVFATIGAITASDIVSMIGIVMEFSGPEDRPTYLGLANTIPGLVAAASPMIGGWVASRTSYTTTFFAGAVCSAAALAVMRWVVREPRHVTSQAQPAPDAQV